MHAHGQSSWAIENYLPYVRPYAPTRSSKPHLRAPPPVPGPDRARRFRGCNKAEKSSRKIGPLFIDPKKNFA